MNNYLLIIGLAEIAIGIGLLSDKKEGKSKVTKILSIINLIIGIVFIVWSMFRD